MISTNVIVLVNDQQTLTTLLEQNGCGNKPADPGAQDDDVIFLGVNCHGLGVKFRLLSLEPSVQHCGDVVHVRD